MFYFFTGMAMLMTVHSLLFNVPPISVPVFILGAIVSAPHTFNPARYGSAKYGSSTYQPMAQPGVIKPPRGGSGVV